MPEYTDRLLEKCLANGTLPQVIISGINKGLNVAVVDLLAAYQSRLTIASVGDPQKSIEEHKVAFDNMKAVLDQSEGVDRYVFLALCDQGLSLHYRDYTYSEADYHKHFSRKETSQSEHDAKDREVRQALYGHPFIEAYRDGLRYLPRSQALNILTELWQSPVRQKDFLHLYDAFSRFQSSQQREIDPQFTESTFQDDIAAHEGIGLIVLNIARQSNRGLGGADVPNLRVLVSNKSIPYMELDIGNADEVSTGTDFWILTAKKTYTDLPSYLRDSLAEMPESRGYGPYRMTTNDDRGYATAASLVAGMQNYLRVPNNFAIDAQTRLRREIEKIKNKAFGNVYAHRFLRAQKWSRWAAAMTLANYGRGALDSISYREAERELVIHGFSHAADFLNLVGRTDADGAEVYEGFKEGITVLHSHMRDLFGGGNNTTPSLDWYEQEFGFNPDIRLFSVDEQKKLAYRNLSDIMLANLCGQMMNEVYLEKTRRREGNDILSQIQVNDITAMYVKAGDVTGFMRLLSHLRSFDSEKTRFHDPLANLIKKGGYYTIEDHTIRPLGGLKFASVIDTRDGTFWIKTENMIHFKTPEQIVADRVFTDAIAATVVLDSLKYPDAYTGYQASRLDTLRDFIAEIAAARELVKCLDKEGIPAEAREPFLSFTKTLLPHMTLDWIAEEDRGQTTQESFEAAKPLVERAINLVGGFNPKPTFERAVRATRNVASLFKRTAAKKTP